MVDCIIMLQYLASEFLSCSAVVAYYLCAWQSGVSECVEGSRSCGAHAVDDEGFGGGSGGRYCVL